MIASIKKATTKKPSRNGHSKYANFDFETPDGIVRCIMWPEEYSRFGLQIRTEAVGYVRGRVDRRGREPNLIVNKFLTLDEADREFTTQMALKFQRGLHTEQDMLRVREILKRYPGSTDVVLVVDSTDPADPGRRLRYHLLPGTGGLKVSCSAALRAELEHVLGVEHIRLLSPPRKRTGNAATLDRPAMVTA